VPKPCSSGGSHFKEASGLPSNRFAFVWFADGVSQLCKTLRKLVENLYSQDVDARSFLKDIVIFGSSAFVRITFIRARLMLSTSGVIEASCA
jgi:hypothetical protein